MIKEKLLAAAGVFSTVFAAIFYVLFQQKKDENKNLRMEELKKENEIIKGTVENATGVNKAYGESKRKNDEEFNKASNGNKLDNFTAGLDLLRK